MKLSERGIIIRKTAESDLREIYVTAQNLCAESLSASSLADMFMSDHCRMFTAVRKKNVLGFIAGKFTGDSAEILRLAVKPHFRRSGIGSALIDSFIKSVKKAGAEKFSIRIYETDAESIEFLHKKDFCSSGETLLQMIKNE